MIRKYTGISDSNKAKLIQIETLITPTLEYVQVGIPEFTSHGRVHSINLINSIINISNKIDFSDAELYILYCSALLHDIGCIRGERKLHNEESIKILDENPIFETLINSKAYPLVKSVILAHSSNYTRLNSIPNQVTLFEDNDTRLRLISAIFRLIDGCDITSSRVDVLLYNIKKGNLPPENKEHWDAHREIQSLIFDIENERILIHTEGDDDNFLIEHLREEFEIINPILKMYDIPINNIEVMSIPKPEWKDYV